MSEIYVAANCELARTNPSGVIFRMCGKPKGITTACSIYHTFEYGLPQATMLFLVQHNQLEWLFLVQCISRMYVLHLTSRSSGPYTLCMLSSFTGLSHLNLHTFSTHNMCAFCGQVYIWCVCVQNTRKKGKAWELYYFMTQVLS